MAFDGITIANIVKELNDTILNGRIAKIAQPENDELLLTIKPAKGQVRLVISASASLPSKATGTKHADLQRLLFVLRWKLPL